MKESNDNVEKLIFTVIKPENSKKNIIAKSRFVNTEDQSTTSLSILWSFYYENRKFNLIDQKTKKEMDSLFLSRWTPKHPLISDRVDKDSWKVRFSYLVENSQDLFIDVHVTILFDIKKMVALYYSTTEILK
ncbi:MAG: hypothetical protein KKH98_11140 [Spirochaetes bacterium]|nr:hypothetical protein [Spirochaetota bacterium]